MKLFSSQFLPLVVCVVLWIPTRAQINTIPPPFDSSVVQCLVQMAGPSNPVNFAVPNPFPLTNPKSLVQCTTNGLIQPYFEDVDFSTGKDFDDPVLGAIRRSCVCTVLGYIESVFKFNKHVSSSNPLIVKFGNASTSMFLVNVSSMVVPNYPYSSPGYFHSYMGDAMLNGGTNLGTNFCGEIYVNFNHNDYSYCGSAIAPCEEDFFSLILHEMTHLIGITSAIEKSSSSTVNLTLGTNTFTEFDNHFLYFDNGTSLVKVVTGTATPALNVNAITLNTSLNKLWLTGDPLATSRLNQPIVDVGNTNGSINPSYSHLEEDFGRANFKSPGFLAPYVMSTNNLRGILGVKRQRYSLQELRMFTQMGFTIQSSYYDFPNIGNTPPRTLGAVISPDLTDFGKDDHRVQTPPAGNSDLYISTTTCRKVVINLNDNTYGTGTGSMTEWDVNTGTFISGHSLNLNDPDGDPMTVFARQLWNITGCGADAANPNPLTLNAAGNVIIFQPRSNFVGRANFGFHLDDGTERGSFIVITIDVQKDCNCWTQPCEMVINGSFEQGTEVNHYDLSIGGYVTPTMIDNTNFWQNYVSWGYVFDQVLADGMEPLEYSGNTNPVVIVNSYTPTYCSGPYNSYYYSISPPTHGAHGEFTIPAPPLPGASSNFRYAASGVGTTTVGSPQHTEANLTLHKQMVNNGVYKLSFRYYLQDWQHNVAGTPSAPFTGKSLELYFNNTFYTGFLTPTTSPNLIPMPGGISWAGANAWQTFSAPTFTYTGTTGNPYMRILYSRNATPATNFFLTDDVSLERDLTPTITASALGSFPATLIASVPGGGVTWQWYDEAGNPIPGANSSTLIVTAYGRYRVVASDGCGCSAETTYAFEPCSSFRDQLGYQPTLVTGTVTSLPADPNNAYFFSGVITIPSTQSFTNCKIIMEPGSSIYVTNQATLTIKNSHLGTCKDPEMWQGISLQTDWGYVHVIGGSLIEDADRAISAVNLVAAGGTSAYILTDDAIFNRNHEAIHIDNYPYGNSYNAFRFVSTVFTSREIATDFATWTHPFSLIYGSLPGGYDPLLPPYSLNANFTKVACRDGDPAYLGIRADNVGLTSGTAPGYTYTGLNVGAEADGIRNLFDNMRCGIESYNSSLYVKNSSFTEMFTVFDAQGNGFGGYGIYDWNPPYGASIRQLQVLTTPGALVGHGSSLRNEFYDNPVGVEGAHNYQASVENALIRTSNTNLTINSIGQVGIRLEGAHFGVMRADSNIIQNCVNGIYISDWPAVGNNNKGYQIARYNTISGTPGAAYSNQNTAINVDGTWTTKSNGYTAQIEYNTITDMYNGISINNFGGRIPYINHNTLTLQTASPGQVQYGISINSSDVPQVYVNTVTSSNSSNDNARAFYFGQNYAPKIGCNTESYIGRGFEFVGTQNNTFWHTNSMTNNGKGMVLNGVIGAQGNSGTGNGNQWFGPWISPMHDQTFVLNMSPTSSSPLYVKYTSTENPTVNESGPPSFDYTSTGQIFITPNSLATATCPAAPKAPYYYRVALEKVAQDSVQYSGEYGLQPWMAQLALYRELRNDSTLTDSSIILQSFVTTAAGSRFDWIYKVDSTLGNGDTAAFNSLLSSPAASAGIVTGTNAVRVLDTYGGDSVMAHYVQYYQLYAKFRDSAMTGSDSDALVSLSLLCPRINGAIIYNARALLRIMSKDCIVYNDECEDGPNQEDNRWQEGHNNERIVKTSVNQHYSLSPNPNDGTMQLRQALQQDAPLYIQVYNAAGSSVFASELQFTNKISNLQLGHVTPGLYSIRLTEVNGTTYSLTFVKK